jgi:opacity protein-like surface antigen
MKRFALVTLSLMTAMAVQAADVPEEADIRSMTESSLISFGRAVKKKDFSGFYEDIAAIWQKQTTPEKLEESFKDFLGKGIDLPSVVKEMEPVFNHKAEIGSNDVLIVKGYYPTTPNRVIFQLKYLEEEGDWKLVGLDVNLKE